MYYTTAIISALVLARAALGGNPAELEKRAGLTPITVSGNAFFQGSSRFYIRGVDYQPGGSSSPVDPIANPTTCKRDIPYFQQLGINTVRVYTVDNTANHDECMEALAAAGIYLALDVNNGLYSINRAAPEPSYNAVYLQSVFATIDAFANYTNTLLFFSGNEVVNDASNTNCAPYVKAVTRDMRAYIQARNYRSIPVGYSAADVSSNRYQLAAYMNCGNETERSDFFSFNSYSWCDPSSYLTSGWSQLVQLFSNYSIPLFLSEFGCNTNPPREFQEVSALYNAEMTSVYSGGLVYEYTEEADNPNYGLVTVSGTTVTPLQDFSNLQSQFKANPLPTGTGGYQTGLPSLECPAQSPDWEVSGDVLPTMPVSAQFYMKEGAGKGPGLSGSGSQNSGADALGPGAPNTTSSTSPSTSTSTSSSTATTTSHSGAGSLRLQDATAGYSMMALAVAVAFFAGAGVV